MAPWCGGAPLTEQECLVGKYLSELAHDVRFSAHAYVAHTEHNRDFSWLWFQLPTTCAQSAGAAGTGPVQTMERAQTGPLPAWGRRVLGLGVSLPGAQMSPPLSVPQAEGEGALWGVTPSLGSSHMTWWPPKGPHRLHARIPAREFGDTDIQSLAAWLGNHGERIPVGPQPLLRRTTRRSGLAFLCLRLFLRSATRGRPRPVAATSLQDTRRRVTSPSSESAQRPSPVPTVLGRSWARAGCIPV